MLVAQRDPILDHGTPERPLNGRDGTHKLARILVLVQVIAAALGIPVALVSGYSVYHSNFSPEATCQSLRTSIVGTLDKSADPSTLRMLLRRDVAAFEQNCATVDPDAVAAFKTLLTATAPAAKPAAPVADTQKQKAVEQAERKPDPVKRAAPPAAEPTRRDTAASDANWLAAVRGALATHERAQPLHREPALAAVPPVAVQPAAPVLAPPPKADANPAAPTVAPPLPPAEMVVSAPTPVAPDNHPVPPAAIPPPPPMVIVPDDAPHRSRLRTFMSHVPLLGRVVGNDNDEH